STYCWSLMPLPWPAPAWRRTLCPARVSSSTPTGIRATRDSCVLISLGTPITYLLPCGIGFPRVWEGRVRPGKGHVLSAGKKRVRGYSGKPGERNQGATDGRSGGG